MVEIALEDPAAWLWVSCGGLAVAVLGAEARLKKDHLAILHFRRANRFAELFADEFCGLVQAGYPRDLSRYGFGGARFCVPQGLDRLQWAPSRPCRAAQAMLLAIRPRNLHEWTV